MSTTIGDDPDDPLTRATGFNQSERRQRGEVAAHARWAATPDRDAAMAPLRRGFDARFEREVDPDGVLTPEIRAKLAASAKRAHMKRLALKSARARRLRKEQRGAGGTA